MLAIDGGGYDTAAGAFVNGNQLAAIGYDQLTRQLSGYAAMAGTDTSSADFAASYDEAAQQAVHALADLAASFANVGRVTRAAVTNHRVAEARSVIGGAPIYDGGVLPAGDFVEVLPSTPPSSLGGDTPALPGKVSWILDHVQGAVIPDADVDRLRAAERTWRAAAGSLDDLVTCCDSAVRGFWGERSPEIPLAIEAARELEATVRDVAAQYVALAAACQQYADHVEAARAQVIELAEWLLEQFVEGVLISAAIGALTGGAGAGAGMAAVLARLAAESPRFARIIETLRSLAAALSASLRSTRDAVAASRVRLVKFTRARVALRDERGVIQLSGKGRGKGWLETHEHSGSHTIQEHVSRTHEQLLTRLRDNPKMEYASTFVDETAAEAALSRLLAGNSHRISTWLDGTRPRSVLEGPLGPGMGHCMDQAGHVIEAKSVRMVLVRDASMPEGYRILTSYPLPHPV
ncbi:hypothetical protein GCM10009844_15830 [Nocardioides koreensis]|uniref:Bacterial CdiA-CT RNAse A domain-containing protein n=2 Tax=Nocardioides koreensis TaxID=433651 RepID=A0ABP5L8L5_9ACTN